MEALLCGSNSFVVWAIINIIYPRLAVRHRYLIDFREMGKVLEAYLETNLRDLTPPLRISPCAASRRRRMSHSGARALHFLKSRLNVERLRPV